MRDRHIKWITNARVKADQAVMHIEEMTESGGVKATHDLPFAFSMMPAFRGVEAVRGIEGLTNPRGFILVDRHQRNPAYPNIFGIGVTRRHSTDRRDAGSIGSARSRVHDRIDGDGHRTHRGAAARKAPEAEATWNAVCLADFGDGGSRSWPSRRYRPVTSTGPQEVGTSLAKAGFERYFLGKLRKGVGEPFYEKYLMSALGIEAAERETALMALLTPALRSGCVVGPPDLLYDRRNRPMDSIAFTNRVRHDPRSRRSDLRRYRRPCRRGTRALRTSRLDLAHCLCRREYDQAAFHRLLPCRLRLQAAGRPRPGLQVMPGRLL